MRRVPCRVSRLCRYQLQVALRAAQKQLADALAALAAAEEAAARAAAAPPPGPSPEITSRLSQLEGALRQATADYQMLLQGARSGTTEGWDRAAHEKSVLLRRASVCGSPMCCA